MSQRTHHLNSWFRGEAILLLFLMLASPAIAGQVDTVAVFRVTYVSSGLIFIDGGRSDGLTPEDTAQVRRGTQITAQLLVANLSSHSASCRSLTDSMTFKTGDSVYVHIRPTPAALVPPSTFSQIAPRTSGGNGGPDNQSRRAPQVVHGSVTVRSNHWNDGGSSDMDYTQSTVGMDLRADGLFGRDISARVRTTSRHNMRQRAYPTGTSQTSWIGSIYEFALIYESRRMPFSVSLGRVIPRRINGVGRLDGAVVEYRPRGAFYAGAFGGAEPQWQYAAPIDNVNRYGVYVGVEGGSFQTTQYGFTLGAASEHHGSTVSRDIICSRGHISVGQRLSVNEAVELEVNRDWRYEITGQRIGVSSLYLTSRYRISPRVTATVSYDTRKNHWTYLTRTVADSLFDDRLRQGLRTSWHLSLPASINLTAGIGYSKREGESNGTRSYSADLRKYGLFTPRTSVSLSAARFTGPAEEGHNLTARIDQTLWNRTTAGVSYNLYAYTGSFDNTWRINHSFTLSVRTNIARSVFVDAQHEWSAGDDTRGQRLVGGLGYRF